MAVEVVAAFSGAEHRGAAGAVGHPVNAGLAQTVVVARDGVPDEEIHIPALQHVDEYAAVAAVEGARVATVGARVGEGGHRCGGGEAQGAVPLGDLAPLEEAEEGRGTVEGAVLAAEVRVAEDAESRLADEGGAEEVLGLVGREAEEDLGDDVVDQRRRRAWRRHCRADAEGLGGVRIGGRCRVN